MPAGALFGSPNGFIAATDERQTQAQTLQSLASAQHLGALTQQTQVQTETARLHLQQERMFLQRLAQYDPKSPQFGGTQTPAGGTSTQADQLDDMASMYLAAGKVKEAGQAADHASLIRFRQQQGKGAAVLAQERLTAMERAKQDDLMTWLTGATDDASYNRGKMMFLARHPDAQIPPELEFYDPAKVDYLSSHTKVGLDQKRLADAEQTSRDQERRHQEDQAEKRAHDARVRAREIELEEIKQRHREMNKKVTGDKIPVVGMPPLEAVESAATLLGKDFPNLVLDGRYKNRPFPQAAIDIAGEAKALAATNRGFSLNQAVAEVYRKKKDQGEFTSLTVPKKLLGHDMPERFGTDKRDVYTPSGGPVKSWSPGVKPEPGVTYEKDGKYWQLTPGGKTVREVPKPKARPVLKPPARTPVTTADDDEED